VDSVAFGPQLEDPARNCLMYFALKGKHLHIWYSGYIKLSGVGKALCMAETNNNADSLVNTEPTAQKIDRRTTRVKTGKSSNPDFVTAIFYLRKETKKRVFRALEDADEGVDASDLVESLLQEWLKKQ
jgi:hypothetical protein